MDRKLEPRTLLRYLPLVAVALVVIFGAGYLFGQWLHG